MASDRNAPGEGALPWRPERIARDGKMPATPPVRRLPRLRRVRRVNWRSIPEHAIVLSGAEVNGAPAPELIGFPPMNRVLKERLLDRYRFLPRHNVIIAEPVAPVVAANLSDDIRTLHAQVTALTEIRGSFAAERERLTARLGTVGVERISEAPEATRVERLVKDRYNSFTVSLRPDAEVPSFLYGPVSGANSVADLILAEATRQTAAMPLDLPVTLHLALDCSYSMSARGKLEEGVRTMNRLGAVLPRIAGETRLKTYLFSDTVREGADLPLERPGIEMAGTKFAALFRRVAARAVAGTRNKLIVITDGEAEDMSPARRAAASLRESWFDVTQILLHNDDDLRSVVTDEYADLAGADGILRDERTAELDRLGAVYSRTRSEEELTRAIEERFAAFTAVTEEAGGNQVVVTLFSALSLVSLEVYDRYLGLLTLL